MTDLAVNFAWAYLRV